MPLSIGQGSGKPNRQLIETDTLQTWQNSSISVSKDIL